MLKAAGAVCAAPILPLAACRSNAAPAVIVARPTDIRIVSVDHQFEEFRYRAPYQFGGRSVDRVTVLNVNCRVQTTGGKEAWGFGSMTLGNAWAFPAVPHEPGLAAMKALADALQPVTAACDERGHPIDLFRALEPEYLRAAATVSAALTLPTPIPKLCTLVVASAFDAAIHDAYGKAFGVSVYDTYGASFMREDLSRDLGPEFKGEYLDRYVPAAPRDVTPVFHSVGASDALEAADVRTKVEDGLPNTLEEWIPRDGLTRFKIKLNGGNLDADVERIVRTDRVVTRVLNGRHVADWKYLLDFNEGCPNVAYLLDCLRRVRQATPSGFERILYIEQPTARDLRKDRANVMHEAARLRPDRHRRVVDRSRNAAARTGDGLYRRGAQGLQGSDAGDADGGRGAEVRDVSLRAGSDVPRRVAHPLGRNRRPRARQRRHRGEREAVCAERKRDVGGALPRCVHHSRWRDANRPTDRPRAWGGAAAESE